MFVISEAEAAAIRAACEQRGEFSAAIELRRLAYEIAKAHGFKGSEREWLASLKAKPMEHQE
jgi:hypothetical protein